jgi:hypothetical protein
MPEERISYLEPIDESEADVSRKFGPKEAAMPAGRVEAPDVPEARTERREGFAEKEESYRKILAVASARPSRPASDDRAVTDDVQALSAEMDADSHVRQLVDVAMAKGLVHAVQVARKLGDFYVLDRMHDELAEKFYDALVERGVIERE